MKISPLTQRIVASVLCCLFSASAYSQDASDKGNVDEKASTLASVQQTSEHAQDEFYLPLLGMEVSEIEKAAIMSSIKSARQVSKISQTKNGLPYRRDAHAKATGCLRATFTVNGDIPQRFQHSIFSSPTKEYEAWIRFSNGDMLVQSDSKPDARGMAIKVMGVNGEKIAPELSGDNTQDFIMTNTPAFFNRNIMDYAEDLTYLAKLQRTRWFISFFPPRLHPKQLYRAIQTVSGKIDTPLEPQYYSMLPYRLGDNELKFSAKPCPGMHYPEVKDKSSKDFLTTAMADQLATQGACFDFMVQPKIPGANMPIDDATVIWSEKKSPFIPVARVNIPPQSFTSEAQQMFCENLSMNPWHGVDEWMPLGSLNRARRLVYNAVSKYRHGKNDVVRKEPDSWCFENRDAEGKETCDVAHYLHETKSKWPLPRCFDSQAKLVDGKTLVSECGDWKD